MQHPTHFFDHFGDTPNILDLILRLDPFTSSVQLYSISHIFTWNVTPIIVKGLLYSVLKVSWQWLLYDVISLIAVLYNVFLLISVKVTKTALKNQITFGIFSDGVKYCLDTRCEPWWNGTISLSTLQMAVSSADASEMEGSSNNMAYITNYKGGPFCTDLGAGLSTFAKVCIELNVIYH